MNWEDRTADYYIRKVFRQWDMGDFATEIDVEKAYRLLAGDFICRLTSSIKYKKGTLTLKFMAAALRQEMTLRRESLREKINDEIGYEAVKRIVIL